MRRGLTGHVAQQTLHVLRTQPHGHSQALH